LRVDVGQVLGRGDFQQLDGLGVAQLATDALAHVELDEARRGDFVTGHTHADAVGNQVTFLEVTEGQREGIGGHCRHVFSFGNAVTQECGRLAYRQRRLPQVLIGGVLVLPHDGQHQLVGEPVGIAPIPCAHTVNQVIKHVGAGRHGGSLAGGDVLQRAKGAGGVGGRHRGGASQDAGGLFGAVASDKGGTFSAGDGFHRAVNQPTFDIKEEVVQRLFRGLGLGAGHAEGGRDFSHVRRVGLVAGIALAKPLKTGAIDVEQLFVIGAANQAHGSQLADGRNVDGQPGDGALDHFGKCITTGRTRAGDDLGRPGFTCVGALLGFQGFGGLAGALLNLAVARIPHPVEEGIFVGQSFSGFARLTVTSAGQYARAGQLGFELFELGLGFSHAVDVLIHAGQLGVQLGSAFAGLDGFDAGIVGFLVFIERVEIPSPPKHLGVEARKEWKRIAPLLEELGLISGLDRAALALYCQAVGRLSELEMAFNGKVQGHVDTGMSYPDAVFAASRVVTPSGYEQQSVIVNLIAGHRLQVHRHLAHFGLSPSARARVQPSNYVQPSLPGIEPAPNQNAASGFAKFSLVQ